MIPPETIVRDLWHAVTATWTDLMGDWFFMIILLFVVGAIYLKTESPGPPLAMMLVMGVLFGSFLTSPVRLVFLLSSAFAVSVLLVLIYRGRK